MIDRAAFLADLLGTPYDADERHCWWLTRLVQLHLFGRTLPFVGATAVAHPRYRAGLFASHPERGNWHEISRPVDGAVAMMGLNRLHDIHAGVYLVTAGGGRIIHTDEPHGVVLDIPMEMAAVRTWRIAYFVPA